MYSAHSYRITKEEYNYLLPTGIKNGFSVFADENGLCSVITRHSDDVDDVLPRLVGLWTNWPTDHHMNRLAYKCKFMRSFIPFREYMNFINA